MRRPCPTCAGAGVVDAPPPTEFEQRVLDAIEALRAEGDPSPSIRAIRERLGVDLLEVSVAILSLGQAGRINVGGPAW